MMKECWINVYPNGHLGIQWNNEMMARMAAERLILNLWNRGKPIYRIHVRMKPHLPKADDSNTFEYLTGPRPRNVYK